MGSLLDTDFKKIAAGVALIAIGALAFEVAIPYLIVLGIGLILLAAESSPRDIVQNRNITVKGIDEPWRNIYGTQRVGGVITFMHLTNGNATLNLVITLAGHEVVDIGGANGAVFPSRIYFDGIPVPIDLATGEALDPHTPIFIDPPDINVGLNQIDFTDHKFTNNLRLTFTVTTGTAPAGDLVDGENYFVHVIDANSFKLSRRLITETNPGHFVEFTDQGTGDWLLSPPVNDINYKGFLKVEVKHGQNDQTAMGGLITEINDAEVWGTDHRQRGRAYAWVRLQWNASIYPGSIPNITFDVKGKKIWDPRIGPNPATDIEFSANPALCVVDYLLDSKYGLDVPVSEIDSARLITAANICEETVGLSFESGTERRYECNGSFKVSRRPSRLIKELLSSMSGKLIRVTGKWNVYAGAHITATETYSEKDLAGPISVQNLIDRRDNFNGVYGSFVSPLNGWAFTSYPQRRDVNAINEDQGRENFKQIDFPFTISHSTAQRLAQIALNQIAEKLSGDLVGKLSMFVSQPPDTIFLDNDVLGWSGKEFEIRGGSLTITKGGSVGYAIKVYESNPATYTWLPSSDEDNFPTISNSNLPNPFNVQPPTGLLLESGTNVLGIRLDGTIFSRIKASWTSPDDAFVTSGGKIEVQAKKTSDSVYIEQPIVIGSETQTFILDVDDGVSYDVRVRSVNSLNVKSSFAEVLGHVVVGKTAPPDDVTSLTAVQNGGIVAMIWPSVSDIDLAGYIIKYSVLSNTSWDNAIFLTDITRTTNWTNANLPQGNWRLFVKAIDTSGNESVNFAFDEIEILPFTLVLSAKDEAPDWHGFVDSMFILDDPAWGILDGDENPLGQVEELSGFVRHHSGVLVPKSKDRASGNDFGVFDNYVENPEDLSIYTTAPLALDFQGNIKLSATAEIKLGAGEINNGSAVIEFRIGIEQQPWKPWKLLTFGVFKARFIQFRLKLDNTVGLSRVVSFFITLDEEPRKQGATNVPVEADGTVIVFPDPYYELPRVLVTSIGGVARMTGHEDRDTTQFTARLFDKDGIGVAGNIDWEASNV